MKLNKKLIIVGLIVLVIFMSQYKKEGREEVFTDIKYYTNSDIVVWSNFDLFGYEPNPYIDVLVEYPITLTSLGKAKLDQTNSQIRENGLTYQIPYSISSCSQLKTELNKVLTYFSNDLLSDIQLNELSAKDEAEVRALLNYVKGKVKFSDYSSSKDSFKLYLPSKQEMIYACDAFISYDNEFYGACVNIEQEWNLPNDFTIAFVCEGNMLYGTTSQSHFNNFISYSGSGSGFDKYRDFYMTHLFNGEIVSSFELGACYDNSDCDSGETCVDYKCTGTPAQPSNNQDTSSGVENKSDSDDSSFSPVILIVIAFGVMMMLMMVMR